MNHPAISVVIPSFNQGKYIERTLLSILKQDYEGKVEVIVSDGGSTDNTIEILEKYNKQITWWSEKDSGYADAVNKGFQRATGEIYAIQSSDDYYLKDSFKNLVSCLYANKENVLVCGREALQESDGNIFSGYELPEIITPGSFLLDHPFPGIFQHTTFFRREIYEKVGGMRFGFDICADADLFYRMLHFGNGSFLNEYTAVYQKHKEQRTVAQAIKFKDKLTEMVLSCKRDEFYNIYYCPTESELDRFQTFIKLFYLQYENPDDAKKSAKEISENSDNDIRIKTLIDQILYSKKDLQKNTDNKLKKANRIIKRILTKHILKIANQPVPPMLFSDKINAGWWNKIEIKTISNQGNTSLHAEEP